MGGRVGSTVDISPSCSAILGPEQVDASDKDEIWIRGVNGDLKVVSPLAVVIFRRICAIRVAQNIRIDGVGIGIRGAYLPRAAVPSAGRTIYRQQRATKWAEGLAIVCRQSVDRGRLCWCKRKRDFSHIRIS